MPHSSNTLEADKLAKKKDYYKIIIAWIKEHHPTKDSLAKFKVQLCKKLGRKDIPTDIEIYLHATPSDMELVRLYLQTKPTRTSSGVAIIATMSKSFDCPHGSCIYCPGGTNSIYGTTPKSYTGKEPSTMRAIRHEYDPYRIIFNRLEQYLVMGQTPEKVDQIIMGGTFLSTEKEYQYHYIYNSFKAYNDFSALFYTKGEFNVEAFKQFFELPGDIYDKGRHERITKKMIILRDQNISTLEYEQKRNETAAIRCIGITVETRPDNGYVAHGLECLKMGVTRIELGIQSVYDDILKAVNRGYGVKESKQSIADLRDLGFKIAFHMMPGLPTKDGTRVDRIKDITNLKKIFDDSAYRPDMLKIYPCMVMPGTPLFSAYDKGIFTPLSTEEAADIIVEAKRFIPEYCRIMRIQRDIPTFATTDGVGMTNLRQYVKVLSKERDVTCKCIRCREIGSSKMPDNYSVVVRPYIASKGKEFFISAEANNKVLGFLRLRLPPRSLHPVITLQSAIVRELHVYGGAVALGKKDSTKTQHQGVGKVLMAHAEDLAKKNFKNKIIVISGVGARDYYRKIGYKFEAPYMTKHLI